MKNIKDIKSKAKEPIRIRYKQLIGGGKSIYLEYYFKGKREYEFLKLYLVPEKTRLDKELNIQTMNTANAVKAKKIIELQNVAHGFSLSNNTAKVNLLEYVKQYAESKEKIKTRENYMSLYHHLNKYSGNKTTFKDIDKNYCMGFIEYLKTTYSQYEKPMHVNSQVSYIKRFNAILNLGISENFINVNPFKQIKPELKPKKRKSEVTFLTIEEVKNLEKTPLAAQNIKNAFLFACYSGLRISDITSLTWDKLQKDNKGNTFINYTQFKTKKHEYLPIGKKALKFLPEREGDVIFKLPKRDSINEHLSKWVKDAGIKKHVTFHVSRHTFATVALSLDVSIATVSKLLGHSDIQTTQIYAEVLDKSKREAMDKLDNL